MDTGTRAGDTLNQVPLSVRFSSPLPNIIRVQIYHHKGRRPRTPQFELYTQPAAVEIHGDAQSATLTSGALTARVQKEGDWRVDFLDGERVVTSSGFRAMGIMDTAQGRFIHEQLNLGVGVLCYTLLQQHDFLGLAFCGREYQDGS